MCPQRPSGAKRIDVSHLARIAVRAQVAPALRGRLAFLNRQRDVMCELRIARTECFESTFPRSKREQLHQPQAFGVADRIQDFQSHES